RDPLDHQPLHSFPTRRSSDLLSQTNTSSNAKAGVMIRQDSTASSAYYFATVTPGNGIFVQFRKSAGAGAQTLVKLSGSVPVYLADRKSTRLNSSHRTISYAVF